MKMKRLHVCTTQAHAYAVGVSYHDHEVEDIMVTWPGAPLTGHMFEEIYLDKVLINTPELKEWLTHAVLTHLLPPKEAKSETDSQ